MRKRDMTFRREELESLPSQVLNEMVRAELKKASIDRDTVLQILCVLEDREANDPTLQNVDDSAAWEEFRAHFVATENSHSESGAAHTRKKTNTWFAKSAVAAAVILVLSAIAPSAVGYENIFELLGRWTQDVFELFNPSGATEPRGEYVFKTDHPGLQQLYEAVSELGVTQPVVPTWLPEGYELKELKVIPMPTGTKVNAHFLKQTEIVSFSVVPHSEDLAHKYEKNDSDVTKFEIAGTTHYVMQNEDNWIAVWAVEGKEFLITTDIDEETLYMILKSIYEEIEK